MLDLVSKNYGGVSSSFLSIQVATQYLQYTSERGGTTKSVCTPSSCIDNGNDAARLHTDTPGCSLEGLSTSILAWFWIAEEQSDVGDDVIRVGKQDEDETSPCTSLSLSSDSVVGPTKS